MRNLIGPSTTILCLALVAASPHALSFEVNRAQDAADVRTLLTKGLYEQAEAVARARVDTVRASSGDLSLEVAVESDLLVEALLLNGLGTAASTLMLAEQALKNKEAVLGRTHPDLARSLIHLGDVLLEVPAYAQAIASLERAVAVIEGSAARDNIGLAEALDHLGTAHISAGKYDVALRVLERSLRVKESALLATDTRIARTLESVARALQHKGAYEEAGFAIRRAVMIQEQADPAHPAYAGTLNLLGLQQWYEGNLVSARDTAMRAVALAERTLRPDHPMIVRSLRYFAGAVFDLGDVSHARSLLERGLAMSERTLGPNHDETAAYLNDLANANRSLGAYPTARALFERALRIAEAKYGLWHDRVATPVHNLALVDASLGDYVSARREQARATAIWERVFGRNHAFVAVALTELASVYREQRSPADALPLLQRALAIRERSLAPGHRDVAGTLADLAATLMQLGRSVRAQALATRALQILETTDAPETPDLATVLGLYAELQAHRGDDLAARDYYERSMAIRAKVFGPVHPAYAEAQAGLAFALANLGDREAALNDAVSVEAAGRAHLRMMLRSLPERQSLNYAAVRPRGLDLILSLTASSPEAAVHTMDGLIRNRALVLDEMATRQNARQTAIESTDPFRVAFTSAQQRLANLVVRGPNQLSVAQYTAALADARREGEAAEQALAERSAEFRAERSRAQLGLDEVRASLPGDSALVSFVRYERTFFSEPLKNPAPRGPARSLARTVPSYLALVLRAHQTPIVVPLGSAHTIDSLVSQWRADIAAEGGASTQTQSGGSVRSSRVSGTALRKMVWDPLAAQLADVGRVFIVPDGTLSLVPFVALPVGQRSYLLESAPVLHYLSAERDLVPTAEDAPSGQGLLAIGGPAFDDPTLFGSDRSRPGIVGKPSTRSNAVLRSAGPTCETVQGVKFSPLAGTLQEVRELSGMWSTSAISNDKGSRVLVGRDASEPAFKKEAHGYRVLHVATHGFFLGDTCAPAIRGTRSVGGLVNASGSQPAGMRAENPLLLSGLALAGANRRQAAAADEDDGILTAEEVASLDLGGVEWAVLSACDTGVGQIKTGEGVFGLRRAFQVAGARTVIMSLWSVDDQATRAWMRALYEGRFQRQLSTADAVHQASLTVLRERRARGQSTHPFFWAAFVAAGDWR